MLQIFSDGGRSAPTMSRDEFLRLIPAPDEAFLAAAKRAVISAGISEETLAILHPETPHEDLDQTQGP
ncbi:hypothetical protein V1281_004306 [Nitrobacteraceae bacterium AZCC 2161]